jgi:hypothetical protein
MMTAVYDIIGTAKKIKEKTKLNIVDGKKNDKGFHYNEKLNISIQGIDSNGTLTEILNQCHYNKIHIDCEIELKDKKELLLICNIIIL